MCHRQNADCRLPIADLKVTHVNHTESLQNRTRAFALRVLRVSDHCRDAREGRVLGQQLLRSGTLCCGELSGSLPERDSHEFRCKLGIVEEEADESLFWLEFIAEAGLIPRTKLDDLISEASQLTAIVVASRQRRRITIRQSAIIKGNS